MTSAYERLKRRHIVLEFACVAVSIALIAFACLFWFERQATVRSYTEAFDETIDNACSLVKQCTESEFDYDTKYREITSELDVLCRLSGFLKQDPEQQTTLNKLYYAFIKLPNEAKLYMPDISVGLNEINSEDSVVIADGYAKLSATIEKFDLLNYGGTPE